ncbi:hypothetical protein BXZ70DRAFT_916462 [Cristinia sonorae]|uniref:Uncharacterized protein n=1 Tax=Cristinia sonorae TaxID=1940300 RepID=A0A8K0V0F1_9AGAR|nr:hypothetical protein BXZ70DRAFT_916462 [Cristinia sonorae]
MVPVHHQIGVTLIYFPPPLLPASTALYILTAVWSVHPDWHAIDGYLPSRGKCRIMSLPIYTIFAIHITSLWMASFDSDWCSPNAFPLAHHGLCSHDTSKTSFMCTVSRRCPLLTASHPCQQMARLIFR